MVRKIRAAEGHPGVLDTIAGDEFHMFNVYLERGLRGRPGEIIATRNGAICRATVDGAVWITHLKREGRGRGVLQAARDPRAGAGRHRARRPRDPGRAARADPAGHTYREISYEEKAGVGYLNFDFYNGAMSTEQCRRLREAYQYARSRRTTKVIVLAGGADFFSNGIHLNVIEAAADHGEESWFNLHAIDDVVREIVETDSHITISALSGDAAAGGVPFAVAADHVVAREDVVLNPYYQHMGGLYGSEYWTYLLPRRVGAEHDRRAHERAVQPDRHAPRGRDRADRRGLRRHASRASARRCRAWPSASRAIPTSATGSSRSVAAAPATSRSSRSAAYRTEELAKSHECFFGEDRSYHVARTLFVYKTGAPCKVALPASRTQAPARPSGPRSPKRSGRSPRSVKRSRPSRDERRSPALPSRGGGDPRGRRRRRGAPRPRRARGRAAPGRGSAASGSASSTGSPRGSCSPSTSCASRHRSICVLLWLHVPALFAFGMLIGHHSVVHVTADCEPDRAVRARRELRSGSASRRA